MVFFSAISCQGEKDNLDIIAEEKNYNTSNETDSDSLFSTYLEQEVLSFNYELNERIGFHYSIDSLETILNNPTLNPKKRVVAFEVMKLKVSEDNLLKLISMHQDDTSEVQIYNLGVATKVPFVVALIKCVNGIKGIEFTNEQKEELGRMNSKLFHFVQE